MRRRTTLLAALLLGTATAAICLRHSLIQDLRDSLNEFTALTPGDPHSRLSPDPAGTCVYCHSAKSGSQVKPLWNTSAEPWEAGGSGAQSYAPPTTDVCLSCHDGSSASGAKGYEDVRSGNRHSGNPGIGPGHPVGMRYGEYYSSKPGEYRNPAGNPGIRLEDGKVGCVSCHTSHLPPEPRARPAVIESSCEACHIR